MLPRTLFCSVSMLLFRREWILCGAILVAAGCGAFNFPTVNDVNRMEEASRAHTAGEHEGMVGAMTEQHKLQAPALRAELDAIVGQYESLAAQLEERAAEVKAEGVDLMGTNGWAMLVSAFPGLAGVGLWARNATKPSRSAEQVAKLESAASASDKELAAVKLALATAAKAGAPIPSDS